MIAAQYLPLYSNSYVYQRSKDKSTKAIIVIDEKLTRMKVTKHESITS